MNPGSLLSDAGAPGPALLDLPTEIFMSIVQPLNVRSLLAVGSTCRVLRDACTAILLTRGRHRFTKFDLELRAHASPDSHPARCGTLSGSVSGSRGRWWASEAAGQNDEPVVDVCPQQAFIRLCRSECVDTVLDLRLYLCERYAPNSTVDTSIRALMERCPDPHGKHMERIGAVAPAELSARSIRRICSVAVMYNKVHDADPEFMPIIRIQIIGRWFDGGWFLQSYYLQDHKKIGHHLFLAPSRKVVMNKGPRRLNDERYFTLPFISRFSKYNQEALDAVNRARNADFRFHVLPYPEYIR